MTARVEEILAAWRGVVPVVDESRQIAAARARRQRRKAAHRPLRAHRLACGVAPVAAVTHDFLSWRPLNVYWGPGRYLYRQVVSLAKALPAEVPQVDRAGR